MVLISVLSQNASTSRIGYSAIFEVEPKSTFNLDRASNDYKTFLLTKLFQIATALILNFKRDDKITALFISFTN